MGNSQLVTVGLAYGDPNGDAPAVHVRTTVPDPRTAVASLRMAHLRAPHHKDAFLRPRREAEGAPTDHVDIPVDSVPARFEVWNEGDRWWTAAQHAGYGLVVEARRTAVDRLALVRVHDIEPYLTGRRAHLRALRGEN